MLTYDELVDQANKLPLSQRLSLLESLAKSVKDEVDQSSVEPEKNRAGPNKIDRKDLRPLDQIEGMIKPDRPIYTDEDTEEILPIKKLRGFFKTEGPIPSDEELEEIRYQYLAEKYGL